MPAATQRTAPADLAGFDRSASTFADLPTGPPAALAAALDLARWPDWFGMHDGWSEAPPESLEPGTGFRQRIKIMGITAEVVWTVREIGSTKARLDGVSRTGVSQSLFLEALPASGGARLYVDLGLSGDPLRSALGASAQRSIQAALDASAFALAPILAGTGAPSRPVLHARTGIEIPPNTPVIVGVGQVVQRHPDGSGPDPVELSARALRAAAADAGSADLLAAADAVYATASLSWQYRDQAALVAAAVGATPERTVVSARLGGDGGQRVLNAAAQAIADGGVTIALVSGAEAGATLSAAQKRGHTPAWPTQAGDVTPTEVLGIDRVGSNGAETGVGLTAPIYMYSLIESAVRAKLGETASEHQALMGRLWSRFSVVGAENPFAWLPQAYPAEEVACASAENRMVSAPYPKLLCANLAVDMASAAILCSAAAAQAAGIPQEKWVFPHAAADANDEWFVSERADLAASPAIRAIGESVLARAEITIDEVRHIDLYSCFPAAVQIAAAELGLPVDDPDRPLTVTGGLTFNGGPGNNYGGHGVASMVALLREDPSGYGLTTSLGWYLTKHSACLYSATPPRRLFADVHPIVDHPSARPALSAYTGPAVLEAFTVPFSRGGEPEAAVISAITPDGGRVLVRSAQRSVIEALLRSDAVRREIVIDSAAAVTLLSDRVAELPPPPPPPVLVDRRGTVTVITVNRPSVRNAIDRNTALLIERAIDDFEADQGARVAVITGAGGAFSAGMDLKAAARGEYPISERRGPLGVTGRPPVKPLIAAVEGPALAGGFELALAADLIVASSESSFGVPEAKRGLVAAAGGLLRLAERLPRAIALELALTGEPMPAARAFELGLINAVVAPGDALESAVALAEQVAANAPLAIAVSKRIIDEFADWPVAERFDRQLELAGPAVSSEDAREGVLAFVERRAPVWSGR
jgi:acetyl-CoA C-acetyltransferase